MVFIRSIKFSRTELMLLKHLSKILFTFRSQVMQKLVPAKVTITSSSKGINSALFLFCTYYSAFYVYIFGTSFGVIFIVTTIECFTDLRDPDNAVSMNGREANSVPPGCNNCCDLSRITATLHKEII